MKTKNYQNVRESPEEIFLFQEDRRTMDTQQTPQKIFQLWSFGVVFKKRVSKSIVQLGKKTSQIWVKRPNNMIKLKDK